MQMYNFLFRLPIVEILDKKGLFFVGCKQKGKYVKKAVFSSL